MLSLSTVALYLLLFGAFGSAPNYIGIYYRDVFKLSDMDIGIVRGAPPLLSIATVPLIAYLGDRYLGKRNTLLVCILLGSIVFTIGHLQLSPLSVPALTGILSLSVVLQSPQGSLLDSLVLQTVLKDPAKQKNYGRYRMWGSLSYGVVSWFTGSLIKWTGGYDSMFYLYTALMAVSFLCLCLFVKSPPSSSNDVAHESDPLTNKKAIDDAVHVIKKRSAGTLLHIILFFTMIWFTGVGMAVIQSQLFLFLSDSLKADTFIMGLTTPFSIALEIPGFFFAPLMLDRFKPATIILIGQGLLILRVALYIVIGVFQLPSMTVLPVELLHGVAYSCIWSASVQVIQMRIPKPKQTLYQGLLATTYGNLAGCVGVFVGGVIAQNFGRITMWISVLGSFVVAVLCNLLWQRSESRHTISPAIVLEEGKVVPITRIVDDDVEGGIGH